jgi:Pyruvate/2-oxoacid:ferredoxin oxidoreductase delta subunit
MSESDANSRIAIVSEDKVRPRCARSLAARATAERPPAFLPTPQCKPKKCRQECQKSCPVVRMGKECIKVAPTSRLAWISEELCIGCGICVKKCPFEAINIINIPRSCVHRAIPLACCSPVRAETYVPPCPPRSTTKQPDEGDDAPLRFELL